MASEPATREIREISAGVVAYNEETNLWLSVRSLLDQRLPAGVGWKDVWVVASGCTDGTVEVAHALAKHDPRVRVITEADRGGKARALHQVFLHAGGDALILLNADARAEPDAVARLLDTGARKPRPFAVMARPVVTLGGEGRWSPMLRWMWEFHHEFHLELLDQGRGEHLSDELLLLSLPVPDFLPAGVINDGSYMAVWLAQHAGGTWYAPDARVNIQIPTKLGDHLSQRRRIHIGNAQVAALLGKRPATVSKHIVDRPVPTLRLVRRMVLRENGVRDFATLSACELASYLLAAWDSASRRADHVRWKRISSPEEPQSVPGGARRWMPEPDASLATERRIASLLRIARGFGTGLELAQICDLLPAGAPSTIEALREWLAQRPELARIVGERLYGPGPVPVPDLTRAERAQQYREYAERLWRGPLAFGQDLVRCAGITGSVAFGEPEAGDDLDLIVVTRSGAMWWFLARAFLALRLRPRRHDAFAPPCVCLNYVLEDEAATAEFGSRFGLLFAREALSAQIIVGDAYYQGLVASAPWMREELPRLFGSRVRAPGDTRPQRAGLGVRALNGLVYPFLATYLQLVGLVRNARFEQNLDAGAQFRTETGRRRLAYASHRFEELRSAYLGGAPAAPLPNTGIRPPQRQAFR